jgi:hypothetical protein
VLLPVALNVPVGHAWHTFPIKAVPGPQHTLVPLVVQ